MDAVLALIERAGNRIPHPFVLFVYLLAVVALASTVLALVGTSVTVPGSGAATPVQGLLTAGGLAWFLTSFVENFMRSHRWPPSS